MAGKFRTPHDSEHVAAIGRAIYISAIYEWTVVHTMEKLRPGFLNKCRFAKNPMTAGTVGIKFRNAVNEASNLARPLASNLKEAARAFVELSDERNELVHAHVYSEPDGRQQLVYQGKDKTRTWSIPVLKLEPPMPYPSGFIDLVRKVDCIRRRRLRRTLVCALRRQTRRQVFRRRSPFPYLIVRSNALPL